MKDNKEDARTMLCEFCRRFFPISEIKYVVKDKDSRIALCAECRTRDKKNEAKKKVKEDDYTIRESKSDDKIQKDSYFCRRCKYKFKFSPVNDTNLKCPYCGRTDSVVER